MASASRFKIRLKAAHQLGLRQVGSFAIYRFGLRTGHFNRTLEKASTRLNELNQARYFRLYPVLSNLPSRDTLRNLLGEQASTLYMQADEIVDGKYRLFGGPPVPLTLSPSRPLKKWSEYEAEDDQVGDQDIKFIWEPGRFGWACNLARAYHLSSDEKYAQAFWEYTERFISSNPSYLGPHWASAQEVAIRIIALAFSLQVFTPSKHSTPTRLESLARAIAAHAERIPPTMIYARSQNNNHLITEALGLYTAAALLRDHPLAARWHRLGWKWLVNAFHSQISSDGTYVQHSTNYHRLMLQAALWMYAIQGSAYSSEVIPPSVDLNLKAAAKWIWQLLDPVSGKVPNLGHNDGSYILPLTVCSYDDFRPLISASAQSFLHFKTVPGGVWDEMSYWLCKIPESSFPPVKINTFFDAGDLPEVNDSREVVLHNPVNQSWAAFRVAHFNSRPAHADQLHMDLWWRGINLAQDPGTYLYNSTPPWDNSLVSAFVHNTITVDGREFMRRAGRFLYLDWAQAKVIKTEMDRGTLTSATASHTGYRKLGLEHTRKVTALGDGNWEIIDDVIGSSTQSHTIRLHWLLPSLEYELEKRSAEFGLFSYQLRLRTEYGWVAMNLSVQSGSRQAQPPLNMNLQLIRAGQLIYGSGETIPIAGWVSPTYGIKIPALACVLEVSQVLPVKLISRWSFPDEG